MLSCPVPCRSCGPCICSYLVDSIALTSGLLQYNRLINLVAEDNAIEDTIYHLHRALNAGRIDLERFLRVRHLWRLAFVPTLEIAAYTLSLRTQTTRILAEEQFMKRALIEKIQAGIPMGDSSLQMRADWS